MSGEKGEQEGSDSEAPRVAIGTGAASGIGAATAARLLASGMTVLAADLRPDAVAAGPGLEAFEVDVVADAIAFFASEQAGYVTGQVLSVSGGLTRAG